MQVSSGLTIGRSAFTKNVQTRGFRKSNTCAILNFMTNRPIQRPALFRRDLLVASAVAAMTALASPLLYAADAPQQQEITIGGTGAAIGLMKAIGDDFVRTHPGVRIQVLPSLGSGGGVKALVAGALQVAVTSRVLTDDERTKPVRAIEFARTPFVFVVQRNNPVSGASLDEIADAFAGKRKTWPDGQPVRPVLRPLSDVDTKLVADISPALQQAIATAHQLPGKNIAITDTDIADELERVPGSIGTSTLVLVRAEQRALKPLSIGGVEPTVDNMRRGAYRYQKSIYIIVRNDAPPTVRAFVEHLQSPRVASMMAKLGAMSANLP